MTNSQLPLSQLKACRSRTTTVRRLLYFWEAQDVKKVIELMEIDIVLGSSIHPLNAFHHLLREGVSGAGDLLSCSYAVLDKTNSIDGTVPEEVMFQSEVKKLQQEQFRPAEQVSISSQEMLQYIVLE
ncbi:hypothetical protein DY000_02047406 [Brassica cretica]|uniref:Uncharacterized protein n=1 Tax=Brassica cretica TaxID=69181 RepID=A0ABQ7F584_BRACR|nr:hypothetical protein DY000_02047406 [Brassica cretica]